MPHGYYRVHCQFTHIDQEGNFHHFDFSPLALSDVVAQDINGHTYHFNICGKLSSTLCHDTKVNPMDFNKLLSRRRWAIVGADSALHQGLLQHRG